MPDLQHAATSGGVSAKWAASTVAPDLTHHLLNGQPLYDRRFRAVQKFHAPGLAPVRDATGAYHIRPDGEPAYRTRFRQTWGYYEDRASVEDRDGWLHIKPNGDPLSGERFEWCGNFREGRCPVRFSGGDYGHIKADGSFAYSARHLYAGDFRDGIAVVRYGSDGLCGHIDPSGRTIHAHRYLDLDVIHKGYARARDERGWFHVHQDGSPAYDLRLAVVEPFYNGQALCETLRGDRVILSPQGEILLSVGGHTSSGSACRLLLIGNIGVGKTTVARLLSRELGWPFIAIDDARRACGDGSAGGEAAAWAYFLRLVTSSSDSIIEFSGSGPIAAMVGKALQDAHDDVLVMWLRASTATCLRRTAGRDLDAPYPDFGVPIDAVIHDLHKRLDREIGADLRWVRFPVHQVDADRDSEAILQVVMDAVRAWLSPQKGDE